MIAFTVVLFSLIALSASQYQQKASKDAAILSEARYLAVNGQFGATYKQEDGIDFKEESDNEGNRKGSYSYIDPSGQRRTVTYTAGKDGFRATGDHLPIPAVPSSPVAAPVAPAVPSGPAGAPEQYHSGQYDPQDHLRYEYREESAVAAPVPQQQPAHLYQPNPSPQLYHQQQPQAYNPLQFQYQSPAAPTAPPSVPAVNYNQYSTEPSPHRFYPPGKLSLNRSPDGFSYTFNKV